MCIQKVDDYYKNRYNSSVIKTKYFIMLMIPEDILQMFCFCFLPVRQQLGVQPDNTLMLHVDFNFLPMGNIINNDIQSLGRAEVNSNSIKKAPGSECFFILSEI